MSAATMPAVSISRPELTAEARIVWLDGIEQRDFDGLDYVRVADYWAPRRTGAPRRGMYAEVLGWSELRPGCRSAASGYFARRVFHLTSWDRRPGVPGLFYVSGAPVEAVDPRTLRAGSAGERTPRVDWPGTRLHRANHRTPA